MKTSLNLLLVLSLTAFAPRAPGQVELIPNTIEGTVRFNNANPSILSLLGSPANEGMSNLYVSAYSLPPYGRTAGSDVIPATSATQMDYQLAVDSDVVGISYVVSPRLSMLGQNQTYYFSSGTSAPVVAFMPGATLDFTECLGVMTVRFVDGAGAPLIVDSGNIIANEISPYTEVGRVHNIAGGSIEQRIYLRGDTAVQLIVTVSRGASTFTDRIQYVAVTNTSVGCDQFAQVDIVVPSAGSLAEATGNVDMLGEFELSVDGYDPGDYADYTGVTARYGPFNNTRYGTVPGVNFVTPSSGTFVLSNLVPSTLDPASVGYVVFAEMYVRDHEDIAYLRTPGLGSGANPPLVVTPGANIDLGDTFVINPGYLRGNVYLQGPAETAGYSSLLRELNFASEYDTDSDGIPEGIGTYGIYYSSVAAIGVDQVADGASLTASYGYGYSGYKGSFNPANNAYEGYYELPLGGLKGETTLWNRTYLTVNASSDVGVSNDEYCNFSFTITDTAPTDTTIIPGQAATSDAAYCLSEVRIKFRSTEPFFSPNIRFSSGGYTNLDFRGQPASYSVYVDPAYGTPIYQQDAATEGQVILYLPQGSYHLTPYITPADSTFATVSGSPIDITVGCGQRLSIEECLRVELDPLPCVQSGPATVKGSVRSCSNNVTAITYQLDGAEPVTACTDCGINPAFNLNLTLEDGAHTLLITATDDQGLTSTIQTPLTPDILPPVIQCPQNIMVDANRPCGAEVDFTISAIDGCDTMPVVVCTPPSGSVFARGETIVLCTALDAAGNLSECSFVVSVSGGPEFPLPTISGASPQLVGIAGGAQMTINGNNFTIDDEVLVDGVPVLYPVLVSPGEIQGQAPALAEGTHDLQIRRCGEIVARLVDSVTVVEKAAITSVEPNQVYARGGIRVLVRGSNFRGDTQIRVGFPAADGLANLLRNVIVAADGLSLTGDVPALPPGELFGPRALTAEDARGVSTLAAVLTYIPNPLETDPQLASLRELESACAQPPYVSFRNGFPVAMNVSVAAPGADAAERARHFLRAYRDLLLQTNPDGDLTLRRTSAESLDHVAFRQQYQGVPVFGGSVVVTLAGEEVLAFTGSLLPPAPLDTMNFNPTPTLTSAQAEDIARQALVLPGANVLVPAHLQIYDEAVLATAASDPHLVWRVLLQGARDELFIDAHNGAVVTRLPLSQEHGGDLHGFDLDMQDAENEANSTDDWCFNLSNDEDVANENGLFSDYANNPQAQAAFAHAVNCYAFFHRRFNWHSYDNDSSQLEIFIRADVPNAAWNDFCEQMQIRDGWVDFEVIVHEFTHGVIRSTSDLIYKHQAGALNESYADMMAIIADREAGDNNWFLGENRTGVAGVVRDFQNIAMDRLSKYVKLSDDNDNGGVHSYSGIANRAGFFMIAGGATNGVRVLPMSQDKVRLLKWEALRNLPDSADFQSARAFEVATAIAWAKNGTHGFNNNDVCTVRNAWAAVEVGWGDADCNGIEDRPSDIDGDFWPDILDNCRNKANINQADSDGDGRGDACDNCPGAFNPGQEDQDGDDKGDVCDDDIDGDGCKNNVDQHPASAVARIGTFISVTCSESSGVVYGSEGGNSDSDGLRDCEDLDDDNDGTPDDLDSCPITFGTDPLQCRELRDCPVIPKDWWMTCMFGGCNEFEARFSDRINPDPTRIIVFEKLQVIDQVLYLQAAGGNTIGQSAKAITSRAAGGRLFAAAGGLWRVELWSKATDGQPARLIAVVGDYDPTAVEVGQTEFGSMLAFKPGQAGAPATLNATWNIGGNSAETANDADQDGMPDGWESRYGLASNDPSDATADLDGDGLTNLDEFRAGTNPADAASTLRILRAERMANGVNVSFSAPAGLKFRLEKSSDLNQTAWEQVGNVLPGQGGAASILDSGAGEGQSFYRVTVVAE